MLDKYLDEITALMNSKKFKNICNLYYFDEKQSWPRSQKRQLILNSDCAFELGNPQVESLCFHMWSESLNKIRDNHISIIGPDLNQATSNMLPFGKIVWIGGHGFTEDNSYERYQEMESLRIKLNLEGYMLRAIPQQNREWSRISHQAVKAGFSLKLLGNELIREYKTLQYVDVVEVIFITSTTEDIRKFTSIGEKVGKVIRAMNKISDDLDMNCSSCDFNDVCDEIEGLKSMHQKTNKFI